MSKRLCLTYPIFGDMIYTVLLLFIIDDCLMRLRRSS